ncbi:MAG: hypothetical protein IT330_02710, partial [Anaerolineae bacterium]|nr:hypothetical protein [Anaerolineae bacterium]
LFRLYAITHALEEHFLSPLDPLLALAHATAGPSPAIPHKFTSAGEFLKTLAAWGYGGIVTGVSFDNYLRDETSWRISREGLEAARSLGLVVWLYDEQGYPSGTAGGLVLEGHPELQALGVTYHCQDGQRDIILPLPEGRLVYAAAAPLSGSVVQLHKAQDLRGHDKSGQLLRWSVPRAAESTSWRLMAFVQQPLYEATHGQTNFYDKRPLINLLDPRATARFIELTHEAYARRLGDFFGKTVQAFFTDEPSLAAGFLDEKPMPYTAIPWAEDLPRLFMQKYGYDLIPALPALFNDVGSETGRVRSQFYDLVAQTCAEAYFGTIQEWCRAHHLVSTGHLLWEEFLLWHIAFEGSAFAALRRMDIPGMDRLSSNPRYMNLDEARGVSQLVGPDANEVRAQMGPTRLGSHADMLMALKGWAAPKLTSSVAHCLGTTRAMIEISSTLENWKEESVDVGQIRATLNWLYALGINTVTSYYNWNAYSPAENRAINVHAGRLGVMLTQGQHVADIAVLYPVTSLWAHFVPSPIHVRDMEQGAEARALNDTFDEIARVLLTHQRDFDFVDDVALAEATIQDGALCLHGERYRGLILPPLSLVRRATMQKVRDFHAAGGVIIAVGCLPVSSLEMGPDPEVQTQTEEVFGGTRRPGGTHQDVTAFLVAEAGDLIDVLDRTLPPDLRVSPASSHILYLHRRTENRDIYFLANHSPAAIPCDCYFRAEGEPTLWDPVTGEMDCALPHEPQAGVTLVPLRIEGYGGLFVIFENPLGTPYSDGENTQC